jgi:hypothetical protein
MSLCDFKQLACDVGFHDWEIIRYNYDTEIKRLAELDTFPLRSKKFFMRCDSDTHRLYDKVCLRCEKVCDDYTKRYEYWLDFYQNKPRLDSIDRRKLAAHKIWENKRK